MVFAFDYRHFGDSEGVPRQLWEFHLQREDIHTVLDFARADSRVDALRLTLWGTSYGGGLVLQVAGKRRDLAAVISQCPLVDDVAEAAAMPLLTTFKILAAASSDALRGLIGASPRYIKLVGQPGEAALLTKPHAEAAYRAIVPEDAPWEHRITARAALRTLWHRPIRAVPKIDCPLLFCVCEQDVDVSVSRAYAAAKIARDAKVIGYPIGHFDIYDGAAREGALSDQLSFLREWLVGHPARGSEVIRRSPIADLSNGRTEHR